MASGRCAWELRTERAATTAWQAAQQELGETGFDDTPPTDFDPHPHRLTPEPAEGTAGGRGTNKDNVERAFPIACLVEVARLVTLLRLSLGNDGGAEDAVVASDACRSSRRHDRNHRHH